MTSTAAAPRPLSAIAGEILDQTVENRITFSTDRARFALLAEELVTTPHRTALEYELRCIAHSRLRELLHDMEKGEDLALDVHLLRALRGLAGRPVTVPSTAPPTVIVEIRQTTVTTPIVAPGETPPTKEEPSTRIHREEWQAKAIGMAAMTGLTMEEIAKRSGVSRATFYLECNAHFLAKFHAVRSRVRQGNAPGTMSRSRDPRTGSRDIESGD